MSWTRCILCQESVHSQDHQPRPPTQADRMLRQVVASAPLKQARAGWGHSGNAVQAWQPRCAEQRRPYPTSRAAAHQGGEHGVHDCDVLRGGVRTAGQHQDARLGRLPRGCRCCSHRRCRRSLHLVYEAQRSRQSARQRASAGVCASVSCIARCAVKPILRWSPFQACHSVTQCGEARWGSMRFSLSMVHNKQGCC